MISADDAYLKFWIEANASRDQTEMIKVGGILLEISSEIFNPKSDLTYSTSLFLDEFPSVSDKSVLDMGSGSGILSIRSCIDRANKVLAVDVEKKFQKIVKKNFELNAIANCNFNFLKSDLFCNVSERFDIILANLPILKSNQVDRFLSDAYKYINHDGSIFLTSASFRDSELKIPNEYVIVENKHIFKLGVEWSLIHLRLNGQ